MRQVILYTAASLDSLIAGPNGEIDWLNSPEYELPGEDYGYYKFYETIDTTLMGHNTYKITLGFDIPFPYADKTNYVFTRDANNKDNKDVKFITEDVAEFVKKLKNEKGKDIFLVGGGQINTILLNSGLIDKMIVTYIPILIGKGIPLFEGEAKQTKFELESTRSFDSGLVQVIYKTKK